MPEWSGTLRNLYWFLRYVRAYDGAARRRYYRRIEAEKKRLQSEGVDQEAVRLFCRWMAKPDDVIAEQRFRFYEAQLQLFVRP